MWYGYDDERNFQCREIQFQDIRIFVSIFPPQLNCHEILKRRLCFSYCRHIGYLVSDRRLVIN